MPAILALLRQPVERGTRATGELHGYDGHWLTRCKPNLLREATGREV